MAGIATGHFTYVDVKIEFVDKKINLLLRR
jgi:hypothetical protein